MSDADTPQMDAPAVPGIDEAQGDLSMTLLPDADIPTSDTAPSREADPSSEPVNKEQAPASAAPEGADASDTPKTVEITDTPTLVDQAATSTTADGLGSAADQPPITDALAGTAVPDGADAATKETPAAEDEAPAAEDEAPAVEDEAPAAAEDEAPAAAEESPAVEDEAPAAAAEEAPAAAEESPAVEDEAPAAAEYEAPAAAEESPAVEDEAPAAAEDEAPAAAEESPAVEDEAPAAAAAEEASPAEEDALAAEPTHGTEETVPEEAPAPVVETFYETDGQSAPEVAGLSPKMLQLHASLGFRAGQHDALHLVGDDTVALVAGNYVVFHPIDRRNVKANERRYLRSTGGRSLGALAIHPSREYIAVGEKGQDPVITIYHFPSLRRFKILRAGTEHGYASLAFSPDGEQLASVGMHPDYLLSVWDWRAEAPLLRTKAFSSDVWRVTFNSDLPGDLTTSGQGHIRFWKMARTFTGLKLQGQIGKFGRTELSDIAAYVELPDGKVLSGSEWGGLLLWEGGFIKCQLALPGERPCHTGAIDVVMTLESGDFATAGEDGIVRIWDFEAIDTADRDHDSPYALVKPVLERKLTPGARILSMAHTRIPGDEGQHTVYLAMTESGDVWQVDLSMSMTARAPFILFSLYSGLGGLATSPVAHRAIVGAASGALRLFNTATDSLLHTWRPSTKTSVTSVAWLPREQDPSGRSFVAAFSDGVLRLFCIEADNKHSEAILLTQALKPHSGPVEQIAMTPSGHRLVTRAADGVMFIMEVQATSLTPVGFVQMDAQARVHSVRWNEEGTMLLMALSEGRVWEVMAPHLGEHDTSVSFRLPTSIARRYTFESMLHILEPKPVKGKGKANGNDADKGSGSSADQDHTDADDAEAEEGEEEASAEPTSATKVLPDVLAAHYGASDGTIELVVNGADAGYLYTCSFDMPAPLRAERLHGCPKTRVTNWIKHSARRLDVLALADGTVLVHESGDRTQSLSMGLHDCDAGAIHELAFSFDGAFLLTAGRDGNVFVLRTALSDADEPTLLRDTPLGPPLDLVNAPPAKDILEPQAYSLEEALEKAERDRLLMTAEERKDLVRQRLRTLRAEFDAIVRDNERLPLNRQLPHDVLLVDDELQQDMQEQLQQDLVRVRAEMNWDLERHKVAHRKLREHFHGPVDEHRIVIKALGTLDEVASFRVPALSSEFRRRSSLLFEEAPAIRHIRDRKLRRSRPDVHGNGLSSERTFIGAVQETDASGEGGEGRGDGQRSVPGTAGEAGASGEGASRSTLGTRSTMRGADLTARGRLEAEMLKTMERREQRERLQNRLTAHAQLKPNADKMDPADEALLQDMQEHMGDFVLKTDSRYQVQPHERVNTSRKRNQLIVLRQRIVDGKKIFNTHVHALLRNKRAVLARLEVLHAQLTQVQRELGETGAPLPAVPSLDAEEEPERRDQYTTESLRRFKLEYEAQLRKEREQAAKAAGGGFGGFGGGGAPGAAGGNVAGAGTDEDVSFAHPKQIVLQSELANEAELLAAVSEDTARQSLLDFRRLLLQQFRVEIEQFDEQVAVLANAKFEVEVRLKFAEYKHVLYYQELVHLRVFDIRERELEQRRQAKQDELDKCIAEQRRQAERLAGKRQELTELTAKEKGVQSTFQSVASDQGPHAKVLNRIFKRRLRRVAEGSESEDSDEEDEDEEEYESSSDESDVGLDFDDMVCPAGVNMSVFDRVQALRAQRQELEDTIALTKKDMERLKKDNDTGERREKNMRAALDAVEREIASFQVEKQARLNELYIAIPLRARQILHHEYGDLPRSLSKSLVFTTTAIGSLKDRIETLKAERATRQKEFKDMRAQQGQLKHVVRQKEERNQAAQGRLAELQRLKFGREVDLEKMETVDLNERAEDLKDEMAQLERRFEQRQREMDALIAAARSELNQVTSENSARLADLHDLARDERVLNSQLNAGEQMINTMAADVNRAHQADEARRLRQLADLQQQEIEALRDEVRRLSKKTGFVSPPARPATSSSAVEPLPPL